jgi:alanyl-tRNA synthetase
MAKPNATIQQGQAIDAAKIAMIKDPKLKQAVTKASQGQALNTQDQQLVAAAAMQTESNQIRRQLYNLLRESEVQQAQVVLAAQDMVDEVQKMSEQVSAMQFKDLPALVDQIKNQIGVDQAMQFNTDATAALAGLLQNLQGARQQLDQALGVVTGQAAPTIPGDDGMAGEMPPEGELDAEPDLGGVDDIDAEIDIEEPAGGAGLGRAKR